MLRAAETPTERSELRTRFCGDDPHDDDAASKAALVGLTRSIARGYGQENILTYIVAPGFVLHERQEERHLQSRRGGDGFGDTPMVRNGATRDVANVIAFLASGLARHATGATIDINGASYFH